MGLWNNRSMVGARASCARKQYYFVKLLTPLANVIMNLMATKKLVEITDLGKIKAISSPRISPDGSRVVFVHTMMDFEKNEYISDLWMANLENGKVFQYTSGRHKDKNPRA
jgi:Tol biopolymer transport system component